VRGSFQSGGEGLYGEDLLIAVDIFVHEIHNWTPRILLVKFLL